MSYSNYRVFTSESVSEGHPDKIADQISDAILDALIERDPKSRVGCEVVVKDNLAIIAGEVKSDGWSDIDVEDIARGTIEKIGYTNLDYGMDYKTCEIMNVVGGQSNDIGQGVDRSDDEIGAGDQGMMFGYATDETDVLMPVAIYYAHRLMQKQAEVRHNSLKWLRPDAKAQISFEFKDDGTPARIAALVLSTQHDPDIEQQQIKEAVRSEIINQVIPSEWLDNDTKFHINPTGRFVIGGPEGDCGLTGRKIIVDTYGGAAPHGGGAFSGKDPSKVDRSACYVARYVAKNIVAAGLASKCEIQLSYAIGVAEPTSVSVKTFGTGKIDDDKLVEIVRDNFNLTPRGITMMLDLERPIYLPTATYGHFGRTEDNFTWEKTDKADELKAAAAA